MDAAALRTQFPVLDRVAFLNAGSAGPLPSAAREAATACWIDAEQEGRVLGHFERLSPARERLRALYTARMGADPADVAVTTSTSEGLVRVLAGLDLAAGDEVLTAPDEHPGLLGPLLGLRERRGVVIRSAPFERLADAVTPKTRLVACSHVSWVTGAIAPAALARTGVPLLLDGAQGLGAVPVDVGELGCAFYAGSGQKWMCGPIGTGALWISPAWRDRVAPLGATYVNLADPSAGLSAAPWPDARRHDAAAIGLESMVAAIAANDVLEEAGWPAVQERAAELAAALAEQLRERGRTVARRGRTTLVAWESADPVAESRRLAQAGVIVRDLPRTPYVRAAVGAWNDERDLDRLLAAL